MAESKSRNINKAFTPAGKIEAASVVTTTGKSAVPGGGALDSASTLSLVGYEVDIFRVNKQNLSVNHTIDSADNAMAAGPLSIDSGVSLTINGNLTVV